MGKLTNNLYFMQNITQYSDQELSLLFMNDEGLYNSLMSAARYNDFNSVQQIAEDQFIYTGAQLEYLRDTFNSQIAEDENDI